jgi:hypothetical protein
MLASELSEPGILLRQLGRAGHRKFWLKVSPGNYPMGPTLRLSQNWSVQYIGDSVFIRGTAGLLEAVKKAKANIDKLNKNRLSIEMLMADLRFKFFRCTAEYPNYCAMENGERSERPLSRRRFSKRADSGPRQTD